MTQRREPEPRDDGRLARRRFLGAAAAAGLPLGLAACGSGGGGGGSDSEPTNAAAPRNVKVVHEELWLTDPRIGIKMDSSEDQGQRLQDAVDLAATARGEGVLRLNPGTVQVNREIVAPKETQLPALIGVAPASGAISGRGSVLQWTKDLGPGKFAIKPRQGPGGWLMQDFEAAGPGQVRKIGQDACKMDGLLFPGKGYAHGVLSHQFRANGVVLDDHQQWHACDFGAGSYGLLWASEENDGLGDHLIVRTHLESCTKAAIGVRSSSAILQARFIQCHIGLSPFSIYRFASGTTDKTVFLFGVFFDNCSFEDAGSAIIFDEVGGSAVQNLVFDSPPFTALNSGYAWRDKKPQAMLDFGSTGVQGLHWRNGGAGPMENLPLLRSQSYTTVRMDDWGDILRNPRNRVFASGAREISGVVFGVGGAGGDLGSALIASERLSRGDVLEPDGPYGCRKAHGELPACGVAIADVGRGDVAIMAQAGRGVRPRVSSGSIASGSLLAPSPRDPGAVVAARGGGQIMGRTLTALTPSNGDSALFGMAA
jgi:hypothetical protein